MRIVSPRFQIGLRVTPCDSNFAIAVCMCCMQIPRSPGLRREFRLHALSYSHSAICSRGSLLEVIVSTKRCPTTPASLPDYDCDAMPRPSNMNRTTEIRWDRRPVWSKFVINLNEELLTMQEELEVFATHKLRSL